MKKKQFAAFLLSGLLVLNTAIPAFAEGMTEQIAENQTQAEPYQADTEAPKLTSISIDKEEVKAPSSQKRISCILPLSRTAFPCVPHVPYFPDRKSTRLNSSHT